MKKILLLGGSAQQIIAIETAKKLGYYTILCDYLPDNPGQHYADQFYLVSTTDKEAVLEVAEKEKIDGILAYASDPAAPTAAYVAEKLGLPGNPYQSVEILCNKDQFRKFLSENGFNTPKAKGYNNIEDAEKDIQDGLFQFPIIVKPVDSSGSKGVNKITTAENITDQLENAMSFSRGHRIIVEEFIEKAHPFLIGGDIFIIDGKVVLWGLLNCHRDPTVNPLVPVGKSYPPELSKTQIESAKATLQELVTKLDIQFGAMNVELIIGNDEKCHLIDAGPRAGGNMIPDLLGMIFDVDVVEMAVETAMGKSITCNPHHKKEFYATHNLHSMKDGFYQDILFDAEIEKYIIKKCLYKKDGDEVEYFDSAAKALGIVFMSFKTKEAQQQMLSAIYEHIQVKLR